MMTLPEKIMRLYPAITELDFAPGGYIRLENALDERGDYIALWEHPDYPRPTDEQLAEIE